ncbi:MAG: hypothetical protein OEZ48_08035 [Candidatus Bathyarchaeota archaeon]|nr:hypothetical protein [Candidatus Bathyarchaeota archaeon]MDH5687794.1 hypothetical protein [Candidatus Bathyarchaeota archaeon]
MGRRDSAELALTTLQKLESPTSKVVMRMSEMEEALSKAESCGNPWNPNCESSEIELYIMYEGAKVPICRSCWQELAETDLEW